MCLARCQEDGGCRQARPDRVIQRQADSMIASI
jgi:hypothetical protein